MTVRLTTARFRLALGIVLCLPGCAPEVWTGPASDSEIRRCSGYTSPQIQTSGATYHVDGSHSAADDGNPGTEDSPWRTIGHAADTLAAGDAAYVHAGTYFESDITLATDGTAADPILLAAWPGDEVTIDGQGQSVRGGIVIDADYVVVDGLGIENMNNGIGTDASEAEAPFIGLVIRNVTVFNSSNIGVHLQWVRDFVVEGVVVHESRYDGIQVFVADRDNEGYSSRGWIAGVTSFDNGTEHNSKDGAGHGVAINQGHSIAVCDSEAYGNTSHGFDVSDWPKRGAISHRITFEGNTSHGHESQAGFSVNSDSTEVLFVRNVAYENIDGFYCYEGCGGTTWVNNTSFANKHGFQVQHPPARRVDTGTAEVRFFNNISFGNLYVDGREAHYPALEVHNSRYEVTASHNNLVPALSDDPAASLGSTDYEPSELAELGPGHLSVDPGFVDIEANDISLQAESPMIDAGTEPPIADWTDAQVDDGSPDIGAFELK